MVIGFFPRGQRVFGVVLAQVNLNDWTVTILHELGHAISDMQSLRHTSLIRSEPDAAQRRSERGRYTALTKQNCEL